MRALGAELIEVGHDFQAAAEHTRRLAQEKGLHLVPSYHPALVHGVATYALELFRAVNELDTVYVPIGQGSGITGVIAARDALGARTRIVGVVAEQAAAWALSFEAGKPVATETAETIADGVACRVPGDDAFAVIRKGTERIVAVSEAEIRVAMRVYFTDTHNVAEGAGATPLAALLKEKSRMAGQKVGLVLSGGNVDRDVYGAVLMET
jgi:threonine dehydratase